MVYLLLGGERTAAAEKVYSGDPHWAAPPLWRSEFRNTLTLYKRHGLLSAEKAMAAMAEAESVIQQEVPVLSDQVLLLAFTSRCSAYDCEFVALARDLGVRLVTGDPLVLVEYPETAVSIEGFMV